MWKLFHVIERASVFKEAQIMLLVNNQKVRHIDDCSGTRQETMCLGEFHAQADAVAHDVMVCTWTFWSANARGCQTNKQTNHLKDDFLIKPHN